MATKLVVIGGVHVGKEIPLHRGKLVIGRGKECQIRPGCQLVSRRHCAILFDDKRILVEDLGSTNGTFVNGMEVTALQELNHGDHLAVGTLELEVHVAGAIGRRHTPEVAATQDTVADNLFSTPTKGGVLTAQEIGLDLEDFDTDTSAGTKQPRKAENKY